METLHRICANNEVGCSTMLWPLYRGDIMERPGVKIFQVTIRICKLTLVVKIMGTLVLCAARYVSEARICLGQNHLFLKDQLHPHEPTYSLYLPILCPIIITTVNMLYISILLNLGTRESQTWLFPCLCSNIRWRLLFWPALTLMVHLMCNTDTTYELWLPRTMQMATIWVWVWMFLVLVPNMQWGESYEYFIWLC